MTAPATAQAVAAAPTRAPGPYATTVYSPISATTSPATMRSSTASWARQSTLTTTKTTSGARRRNGTQAKSAAENANPTATSLSSDSSLGRANATSSTNARHASASIGRASHHRVMRPITRPRIGRKRRVLWLQGAAGAASGHFPAHPAGR